MSDSFRPHGLQHARLTCPSLSPRVYSNSCPLSWWCGQWVSWDHQRQWKWTCQLLSCIWLSAGLWLWPNMLLIHGILQARIIQWVAIPFSRGSSWPRDWTCVSCIPSRFFTIWATREVLPQIRLSNIKYPVVVGVPCVLFTAPPNTFVFAQLLNCLLWA